MIPLGDNLRARTIPFFNIVLVLVNIAVFYLELTQPGTESLQRFFSRWSLAPAPLLNDPFENGYRVLTSMFLHGGWLHLIGNMLYLLVFGDNVEDRMGHFRYLFFYLTVGVAAALSQVFLNPLSMTPMVGASGAIAGVMGAYFVLYPGAMIRTLVPIFIFVKVLEIPAIFFLGFWFILQAFQSYGALLAVATGGTESGGVAWWAHSGGFLAGFILVFFFRRSAKRQSR
jgi:membrane associated rhomboid family serine protease